MFNDTSVTHFELIGAEMKILDMAVILRMFPNVSNVSITDGDVDTLLVPKLPNSVKALVLRRLLLSNITGEFVRDFPELETLDLRENLLQSLPINFYVGSLKELWLGDNLWNCSLNQEWILSVNKFVLKDATEVTCRGAPYPGKPLISIAQYLKDLNATCVPACSCSLFKVVQDIMTDALEPMIYVNCSAKGLTQLPENLPMNTRMLHLESNMITDLEPLRSNPAYRSLWDLYLDDNQIESIDELEGSQWLRHFRAFSLRGNKLTKVPAYALDNALEKNPNMPIALRLYLGGNPWRCDCVFVPVFQELVLQKYAAQIKDMNDVKCSYVEGDENSLMPIMGLSKGSVCRLPPEYSLQEGLDLLNAVLATLIVFVLGKLAYDYYRFKTTGRLPWIVTKMP